MELPWRNKVYTFEPEVIRWHEDGRYDVNQRICGADTETVEIPEGETSYVECQCITFSTPTRSGLVWIPEKTCALIPLLDQLLAEENLLHKETLFVYIHNLGFDAGILFKYRPDLMLFARAGVYQHGELPTETPKKGRVPSEYYVGKVRNRQVFLKNQALFIGTAPHFTFRCYRNRKDYVDLTFLDSGSFFRGSLQKVAESLELPIQKEERQADLGQRDYRKESHSKDKWDFMKYAMIDSEAVRLIGEKIVELHEQAGFTKLRVSAPGFAHSYFTSKLRVLHTVIYNGSISEDDMKLILESYSGGRTGGLYHGSVENISVFDFASSYPAAMLSLPSFGPKMKYRRLKGSELKIQNVINWLMDYPCAFLRVSGVEHDPKYPSLIKEKAGRLTPVYGEFSELAATGPEVIGGVLSGTLELTEVHEAVFCIDTELVESPFRLFAEEAYQMKQREKKDTIPYLMAKLLLNSAYGKWIQSDKSQLIGTDAGDFICTFPEGQEAAFARMYLEAYAAAHESGEDPIRALEEIQVLAAQACEIFEVDLDRKPLDEMDLQEKTFAKSAIPAAAALVTGIARARLRALMKCTNAIYWDTDSVFIQDVDFSTFEQQLSTGSQWIHPYFVPLRMGQALGELDLELENASGWLAGTKRYFLEGKKKEKDSVKKAIHGIVNLPRELEKEAIASLATGADFTYLSKASPLKAKQTTDARVGLFVSKTFTPKFQLDPRLSWSYIDGHYEGRVQDWKDLDAEVLARWHKQEAAGVFAERKRHSLLHKLREQGYVKIPRKDDPYYFVYQNLSKSRKSVFRKQGLPYDEMADTLGISVTEMWETLQLQEAK